MIEGIMLPGYRVFLTDRGNPYKLYTHQLPIKKEHCASVAPEKIEHGFYHVQGVHTDSTIVIFMK